MIQHLWPPPYFLCFKFLVKDLLFNENLTLKFDSAASSKGHGRPSYFSWSPLEVELSILIFRGLGKIVESDC